MNQWRVWVYAIVLAGLGGTALADEIKVDQIVFSDIRITNIAQGKVEYIARGAKREIDLDRIAQLKFTRYPGYAQGVAKISSDPRAAAESLRGTLDEVREDFLRPLFRLQLSKALDQAGDFEGAVENYLAALEADRSKLFLTGVPTKVPADADKREAAAEAIKEALKDADGRAVKIVLRNLLKQVGAAAAPGDGAKSGNATDIQPGDQTADESPPDEPEVKVIKQRNVEALIRAEKFTEALQAINESIGNPDLPGYERILPDLYYQRASVESKLNLHVQAAATYLRVAVQFSDNDLAPAAWEQAGQEFVTAEKFAAARQTMELALQRLENAQAHNRIQQALDRLPQP